MPAITKLDEHSQGTTRDKYKTIARAKSLRHEELMDHIQNHMLSCCDDDCDICDLGQSGSMIDDDSGDGGPIHSKGTKSSPKKSNNSVDDAGCLAEKSSSAILAARRFKK
jgi:hypothetical protein